ncbi:hypothetical protein DFH07DRAFT_210390 [Mycena maculata]|uniref:F-box domain-containing protein n=1 Tax=Mycena maculata TaxID=230809 RepID=A0AAD7KG63_9AGAR|nr:hypothetical protein DFH07DRAFT_210390 [Mycena maculata]
MPSLPDLPTELLMETVKYYPALLSSVDACVEGVAGHQYCGNDTIRALSQTSRTLRDIFLPVLWERVNVTFTLRNRPKRKIRTRAKMLERRMRGIQKTPQVATYIRSLSITLEECHLGNWQPLSHFIRVLGLLPNLRNLTILGGLKGEMITVAKTACQGKVYPSVVTLALPDGLAPILHSFPHVRTLHICDYGHSIFREAKELYTHVDTVKNINLLTSNVQGKWV